MAWQIARGLQVRLDESGKPMRSAGTLGCIIVSWLARRGALLLTLAALACCAVLIRAAYDRGLERGMAGAIEWGPNYAVLSLRAAITDLIRHENSGYVAAGEVARKLTEILDLGNPDAKSVISRLHDPTIINQAITEAAEARPEIHSMDHGLQSLYQNDLGYIDYAKLAFSLFGLKIESLYLLFFVLFGMNVGAFIISFGETRWRWLPLSP